MPESYLKVHPQDLGIEKLFATVRDAVIVAEAGDGRVVLWNPAATELFGFSRAEALGMRIEDLMPGLRAASQPAGRERYSESGAPSSLSAVRKGGERIAVETSLSPIEPPLREGAGPERFVLAIVRDVTRRERHEAALREAQELFRSAFDNAPIGVAVVGLDGRFLRVNRSLCEMLGYPEEELLSLTFRDITHPEDLDSSMENVRRLVEGEVGSYSLEKRYVGARGDAVWVSLSVSLVRDREGEPLYFVDQIKDITERRKASEELARRAEELARANAELEQFSYSVSHDLRAPLRAIDGFSHVLMEVFADDLGEEGAGYLMRVRANSQRMGALIDDLLDLSRITRTPLRRQRVDLSSLADSVLDDLRRSEPDRRVETVLDNGLVVNADAGLMRVALENLLSNAWKFTSREPVARIELGGTVRRRRRTYFVRDNGAGFDEAYAEKLFAPFQRLHAEQEFEGTGIGLATVQRVIHRHGGQTWAESAPGAGATFFFTL
ncbi:MAG TPA: PAS domain S-box protein [Rubrobacteraceae bacterium]|nr:PAS domain S-box protein [Rubrobacteraceae bacterium]